MDLGIIGILEMEIIQNEKHPEHIYASPGTYTVELKVYSKNNKSFESDFKTVIVKDLPVSVVITSIVLSSFPELNWLENSWDVGGLPDIRFQIVDGITTYLDGAEVAQDADFNLSYTYYNDFPITLPYDSNYLINVLDEDGVTDELISVINFNPTSYSLDEESSVTIIDGGLYSNLKIRLGVLIMNVKSLFLIQNSLVDSLNKIWTFVNKTSIYLN